MPVQRSATLQQIGLRLEKHRRAMRLSLCQLSRPNPQLSHENFALAESGGITDGELLRRVIKAYHLPEEEARGIEESIGNALLVARREAVDALSQSSKSTGNERKVRAVPFGRGQMRPVGHQIRA